MSTMFQPQQLGAIEPTRTMHSRQQQLGTEQNQASSYQQQENQQMEREAASEILVLVLNGGPKWGFRIKQLNDNRVIVSRVDKGPAERSGLRVYDELLSVNHVELSNSPRSLLLHDYPNQFATGAESRAAEKTTGQTTGQKSQAEQRTPLLAVNSKQVPEQVAVGPVATAPGGCQLSKLDFAYQLIKHSSASNKLVLVVRRFVSAAYARASALAASNMLAAWNFSSSSEYRPSISDQPAEGRHLRDVASYQDADLNQTIARQNQRRQLNYGALAKRANNAMGTNVYKCCDCYCDNGASGPSEDEENERQLIEQLKQENHRRQLRQIEQQQQLARQQQAQQTAQVVCFHEAATTTAKSTSEPKGPSSNGPLEDGAPQVPVRRSSRQAASTLCQPSDKRADSFCNDSARTRGQVGNRHEDDDDDDDPEPDLSEDDSLLPPPPRLHAMSAGVLAGRPPLPPPPPPPQLHQPMRSTHQMLVTGKRTKPLLPPPPPPRTRSCQHAPKNIWSPSSSSVLSSSSPSSSSPMTSEPDLESEQQQQQMAQTSPAVRTRMEIPLRNGDQTDGSGQPMSSDDLERSLTNEDHDQDETTVVERHLGELTQSSLAGGNTLGLVGPGERATAVAVAELTTTSNANGATSETTLMEPQGNKMGVADGVAGSDGVDDYVGSGARAAPINKELQCQQAASRKLRSFSVAAPNNPMSEQQQRRVGETTGSLVPDQMRRVGGGGSRGGLSSFVGTGQARSFSIATSTLQPPLLPSSSIRAQQVAGARGDKLNIEAGKSGECHLSEGASLPDARIAAGQTEEELESDELTFSQQKQQQLERNEQQSARPMTHSQQQQQQARGQKLPSYAGTVSIACEASDGLDGWPQAPSDERGELSASRTADDMTLQNASADQQTKPQQGGASKAGPSGQVFAMESESDERDQLGAEFNRLNSTRDECYKRQLIERRTITKTTTTTKTKLAAGASRPGERESNDGAFDETKVREVVASGEEENEPFASPTRPQNDRSEQQQKAQSKEDWFKSMYKQMHKSNAASAERGLLDAVNSQQNRNEPATSLIKIKLKSPRSDHRLDPSYFSEEDLERRSASPVFNGQKPGNICDYLPGQSSISQHERNLLLYHKLIEHINRVFSSVLQQTGDGGAATSRSTNALHATCGHQQQRSRATNLQLGHSVQRPRSHSMRRSRRRLSSGGGGGIKRHKAQQSASGPQTPANSGGRRQDADSSWGLPAASATARTYHVRSTRLKDLASTSSDNLPSDSQHKRRCVFEKLATGLGDNQDARDGHNEQEIYHRHQHHRMGQHASNSLDRSSRFATGDQQLDYTTLEVDPDSHRQYVAVQQGRDIPLKGLRKPAPQPNIYKVGPAPPPLELGAVSSASLARELYRDHNLRLAKTLNSRRRPCAGGSNRLTNTTTGQNGHHNEHTTTSISRSLNNSPAKLNGDEASTWRDELYRDFDTIYAALCQAKPASIHTGVEQARREHTNQDKRAQTASSAGRDWSSAAALEMVALNDSLAEIERRAFGRGPQQQQQQAVSPQPSIAVSDRTTTSFRADSRNTEQSVQLNGPALVEEMTLSDLEDEICSTLMAAKDAERERRFQKLIGSTGTGGGGTGPQQRNQLLEGGEHLLKGRRCRQPISSAITSTFACRGDRLERDRMFDDKSINIHYKTPTSRLLKMNTLNEFELNQIKKFYAQELLNRRLTRSKSTRLTRNQRQQQQLGSSDACWVHPPPLSADPMPAESALVVDPKRYQHALGRKSLRRLKPSSREQAGTIGFARALYDFAAKHENELAMRRGDLVEILGLLESASGWVRVEDCQSGLQGLVPIDYLDHRIGCAVARRDVNSRPSSRMAAESQLHLDTESPPVSGEQLLPMSRGEPIALIRRLSGHLYEASNTRQAVGLVWSNDVDIIKQPPPSGQTADEHQSKANYEAPMGTSNYRDEAKDYLTDEDDDSANDDSEVEGQGEEELARCLRSICELKPVGARSRHEIPLLYSELAKRRRARSASGALNEAHTTTSRATTWQQQAVASERQQQYCTMSRRQQQQVAAACCSAAIKDRHCCNCRHEQCNEHQTTPAMLLRRPSRSSSSPQIWAQSGRPENESYGRNLNEREPGPKTEMSRLYRARFAYKPQQSDELELAVGDILVVAQECDDGWLIGSSYTTKQTGTFPGNFVEPL